MVKRFGVKAVVYGGPGLGKTPLLTTAPHPVICFTEPGMLSIRKYEGPGYEAFTYKAIKEFWTWAIGSQEARQFQTFCCDSFGNIAEIILKEELPKHKDPRKAYGELSLKMMEIADWIFYAPNFYALLMCKEGSVETDGVSKFRPYFPGQDLNIKIPHLFDSVWRIENIKAANGSSQRVIRTRENFQSFARDRSGNLAEIEPADISYLFQKSMQ